jgi:hypothetical protein
LKCLKTWPLWWRIPASVGTRKVELAEEKIQEAFWEKWANNQSQ